MRPYVEALHVERQKEKPSQAMVEYCKLRMGALDDLREELDPNDTELVDKILSDPEKFF